MKTGLLDHLQALKDSLDSLHTAIRQKKAELVSPSESQISIRKLAFLWSEQIEPALLSGFTLQSDTVEKYRDLLKRLHELGARRSRRTSFLNVLSEIRGEFTEELITPVLFAGPNQGTLLDLKKLLDDVHYPDQKGYLDEAIRCAEANCIRGATVLGWSATMHHIHCKIEEMGFDVFNQTKDRMSGKSAGRFKGFSGIPNIESISDLRETPDRRVLAVMDYMGLLESNQRQRLERCLDMRIQSSHPGDAPMTMANLVSFFSDLSEIIFRNEKFLV